MKKWNITYYIPPTGAISPLVPFIENLYEKARAKLSNTFSVLQDFGTQVGPPHVKKLKGTSLWEVKILGQDNILILYIVFHKETFLLLHGFLKKKQKTPKKEIEIALN